MVSFNNPMNQFVKLQLINNNGTILNEFITTNNQLSIDLTHYSSGTYYLFFNPENLESGCNLNEIQRNSTKIILNK